MLCFPRLQSLELHLSFTLDEPSAKLLGLVSGSLKSLKLINASCTVLEQVKSCSSLEKFSYGCDGTAGSSILPLLVGILADGKCWRAVQLINLQFTQKDFDSLALVIPEGADFCLNGSWYGVQLPARFLQPSLHTSFAGYGTCIATRKDGFPFTHHFKGMGLFSR